MNELFEDDVLFYFYIDIQFIICFNFSGLKIYELIQFIIINSIMLHKYVIYYTII